MVSCPDERNNRNLGNKFESLAHKKKKTAPLGGAVLKTLLSPLSQCPVILLGLCLSINAKKPPYLLQATLNRLFHALAILPVFDGVFVDFKHSG